MKTGHIFNTALLAAFLSLTACGGGDGDADPVVDITPDAFTLKDIKDADPGEFYTASMTVGGVDAAVKARVDGNAEFSVDGGKTWQKDAADVENGGEVMIRLKSKDKEKGVAKASLFIGGTTGSPDAEGTVSDNFQVVTKDDIENPELAVHFPPASGVTNAASVRVRGIARDDSKLRSLTVNGDSVVPDPGTGRWQYELTLAAGANPIKVRAKDTTGKVSVRDLVVDTTSTTAGSGEALTAVYSSLDVSPGGSSIFYGELGDTVYQLDLETGERTVLSREPDIGAGPAINFMRGMSIGRSDNELLVADHGHVLAVDTTNGNRTDLSNDSGLGAGANFNAMHVASDPVSGMLYVASNEAPDKVISVELPSGDRTLISDAGTGAGPALDGIDAITVNKATGMLFVSSNDVAGNGAIFSVDPANGDRTNVSAGAGSALPSAPTEVRYWQEEDVLLAVAVDAGLFRVDPANGDRTLVSGISAGSGPAFNENLNAMGLHEPTRIAYMTSRETAGGLNISRIFAIDLENGDRIIIAAD